MGVGAVRHGRGVAVGLDGFRYDGEWEADRVHGFGEMVDAHGDSYKGEFASGRKHGQGTYQHADWPMGGNSFLYEGQFVNNEMQGDGVYLWPGGCKYEGQWKSQQMN